MRAIPRPRPKQNKSAGWIITFADLMSLLLTFFILLLSFSNMDVAKYEAMAKALGASFGLSAVLGDRPQGGDIIFAEQPPLPQPPPSQAELEKEFDGFDAPIVERLLQPDPEIPSIQNIDPNIDKLTDYLVNALASEILSKALSVTYDKDKVVVRFSEASSFNSGSELLKEEMYPILSKIENVLAECQGDIVVEGYTDNLPVSSGRFRSNWDLSAGRAVSVVHQLIFNNKIDVNRVMAAGRAETNALVDNDTSENRSRNRRVEINIYNPKCQEAEWVF